MADTNNILDRAVGEAKTISSEISDYTKQRFSHPLFLSLIISFAVYNWRPISIFIFSKQPVEKVIEHLYSYDNKDAIWSPVLAAILYTLAFPFLKNGIGSLLKRATDHEDSMRHKRNIALAEFKEEEAAYEYKIATKRSGTNELTAMQTVIDDKEAMITSLKNSLNTSSVRAADLEEQTRRMEERLLQNYVSKVEQGKEDVNVLKQQFEERDAILNKFNAILEQSEKLLPNEALEAELMALVEVMNTDEREWVIKTAKRKTFKSGVSIRPSIVNILLLRAFLSRTGPGGYAKTPKFQMLIKKVNDQALWDSVHPQL